MVSMIRKFTGVAGVAAAAVMALAPAHDASAQIDGPARNPRASAAAYNPAQGFSIGRPIPFSQLSAVARQHNQPMVARMNMAIQESNGNGGYAHFDKAVFVTVNPETGRGWILMGDRNLENVSAVTPVLEIADVVMFNSNNQRSLGNFARATTFIDNPQWEQECSRWQTSLNLDLNRLEQGSLRTCNNKNAWFLAENDLGTGIDMVGHIINVRDGEPTIFYISFVNNVRIVNNIRFFGRMGVHAATSENIISEFRFAESVRDDIEQDRIVVFQRPASN